RRRLRTLGVAQASRRTLSIAAAAGVTAELTPTGQSQASLTETEMSPDGRNLDQSHPDPTYNPGVRPLLRHPDISRNIGCVIRTLVINSNR
ncbi:MAG: hypothetical protein ACK56I_10460, partial [bacterium]